MLRLIREHRARPRDDLLATLMRAVDPEGTGALDEEFGRQLVAELNTYVAADAVLTVSEKEAALLEDVSGKAATGRVIPDIESVPDDDVGLRDRSGMLFVGSFRHMPNVYAVEHLCREIVPRLRPELLIDHPISIVGDGLDDAIRRYADGLAGVRMIGWVPDVLPYLQRARVSLVPLPPRAAALLVQI